MNIPVLTCLMALPLAGAALLVFLPKERKEVLYGTALAVTLLVLVLAVWMFIRFDGSTAAPQFVERAAWLGGGIQYHLGVDGISLVLILLTAFLVPLALLSSWNAIRAKLKEYLFFLLLLEAGVIGVFAALNLFLFYVFWEAMLIPMVFLIGVWGGPRRVYAATKFVLVTMSGSLLMLAAILVLGHLSGQAGSPTTYDIFELYRLAIPAGTQTWLFLAFALAFAIKVPIVPLHTWLPDAHVEAPTAGSVLLAAVLLKMGAYGFLRLAIPLFPDAAARFLPALAGLAIAGILYGGFMALVQKDIKSLVAYSSVSHMGLIMLALFSLNIESVQGAVFQMLNHGLSTGLLFLLVGILYERAHTRAIADFGGVARVMPVFAGFFLIASLSSLGLPGLNGFVGEFLCFYGIFGANPIWAVLAVPTVILAAAYLLGLVRRVMHGPVANDLVRNLKDISAREIVVVVPIVVMIVWMGLFPRTFLAKTEASVAGYIQLLKGHDRVFVRQPAPARPAGPGQARERSL
ncbi:MAG: NADH-quinone oxidoreductase subunit M [Candidatus Aminicenantes bacterium]|nr:NADH-quinone oxidoreductase subunit M [Candidatus Aminicenantes bacterium]